MAQDSAGRATGMEGGRSRAGAEATTPDDRPATEAARREAAALRRVGTVSHLLDEAVRVPGTNYRVGLDPILGILPVGGDAVAMILSLYPIAEAYRFGVPKRTLLWMLGRIGVDATVGSIPVLGTLFDAVWKANERNRRTLERHLDRR